jgi:hypothetical protein
VGVDAGAHVGLGTGVDMSKTIKNFGGKKAKPYGKKGGGK